MTMSSSVIKLSVAALTVCPSRLSLVLDRSKLSVMNSNGFNKHIANTTVNGHSLLALQAYSAGLTSPNTNGPLLLIKVKLPARLESNGLNKTPSPSTGMWLIRLGRAYLSYRPARSPWRITPSRRSSHRIRLLLVYGATPYSSSHHVGCSEKPSISQGQRCGRSVS